jgi:phosphoglycolate phosphatase-like HAD superfamily hydrolase
MAAIVEPMTIEGIVFDLDATLVNLGGFVEWREAHRRAIDAYLSCGCPEDVISRCGEKGLFNMLNLVRDELSTTLPASEVERIQWRAYEAITSCEVESVNQCHLMPACVPTLEWLRDRGYRMGVATSNSEEVAKRIMTAKGIDAFFDSVVGRRPELRMKPHPDQILKCFDELGIKLGHGIVVGDSVRDVAAARLIGSYSIAVPSFFTKREALVEAGVDKIIESLDELPSVIEELCSSPGSG